MYSVYMVKYVFTAHVKILHSSLYVGSVWYIYCNAFYYLRHMKNLYHSALKNFLKSENSGIQAVLLTTKVESYKKDQPN